MQLSLYRREVFDNRRTEWFGTIALAQPVSTKLMALVAAFLIALLVSVLVFGSYRRTVSASGKIVPARGVIHIYSPQSGQLVSRFFSEGDRVRKGDVLYSISSSRVSQHENLELRFEKGIARQQETIVHEWEVQQRRSVEKKIELEAKGRLYENELAELARAVSLQKDKVFNSGKTLERYRTLFSQGYISDIQWSQVRNDFNHEQLLLTSLNREQVQVSREAAEIWAALREVDNQAHIDAAYKERSLAILDQQSAENASRAGNEILAPIDGIITAQSSEVGESVLPQQALAAIVPDKGELVAHLFIPSKSIGQITEGQAVKMRLSSFPYQKFGFLEGSVASVELSPTNESRINHAADEESVYRVVVGITDRSRDDMKRRARGRSLKPGMSVHADIRLSQQRLIGIVLDPLSITGP